MAMTKQNYEAIAEVLAAEFAVNANDPIAQRAVSNIVMSLADKFVKDNPRFDRERFYKACGITK